MTHTERNLRVSVQERRRSLGCGTKGTTVLNENSPSCEEKTMSKFRIAVLGFGLVLLVAFQALGQDGKARNTSHYGWHEPAKTLYVWAGAQAREAPAFRAALNFAHGTPAYGKATRTPPRPPSRHYAHQPHH